MEVLGKRLITPVIRFRVQAFSFSRYIYSRSYSQQSPFDLEDEDEKFKDINQMYVEMFTDNDDTKLTSRNEGSKQPSSDLDELNDDMNDLLNVGYHKLTTTELEEKVKVPGRFILQSLSNNPYYNLAIESYVFSHTPIEQNVRTAFDSQRLLFYVNRDCVVIGKNQNVWRELHVNAVQERGYELMRRFSGGGTVVHDQGNVNYSFITSREEFRREYFNQLIVASLKASHPNLDLKLNGRGDIALGDRKVSGSAYKISRGKSYHHGTMLIRSNLDQFHGLLKPDSLKGITWKCNSVDSVRSAVENVPLDSTQQFIDVCADGFKQRFKTQEGDEIPIYYCDEDMTMNDEIKNYMSTLCSDEWKYMSGPRFEVRLESSGHSIAVEKGVIVESSIPTIIGTSFLDFTRNLSQFDDIDPELIL